MNTGYECKSEQQKSHEHANKNYTHHSYYTNNLKIQRNNYRKVESRMNTIKFEIER